MLTDVDLTRDRILGREELTAKEVLEKVTNPDRAKIILAFSSPDNNRPNPLQVSWMNLFPEDLGPDPDAMWDAGFSDRASVNKAIMKMLIDPTHTERVPCHRCGAKRWPWDLAWDLCTSCDEELAREPNSSDSTMEGLLGLS